MTPLTQSRFLGLSVKWLRKWFARTALFLIMRWSHKQFVASGITNMFNLFVTVWFLVPALYTLLTAMFLWLHLKRTYYVFPDCVFIIWKLWIRVRLLNFSSISANECRITDPLSLVFTTTHSGTSASSGLLFNINIF